MKSGMITVCLAVLSLIANPFCLGQQEDAGGAEGADEVALDFLPSVEGVLNTEHLERLQELLVERREDLLFQSQKLGESHPKMEQLKAQIAMLEQQLAGVSFRRSSEPELHVVKVAHALQQRMQVLGDTMESLANHLERLEKLEDQLHAEAVPSRKEFFESTEKMYLAGRKYYAELEQAIQDQAGEAVLGVWSRSKDPEAKEFAERAQLHARHAVELANDQLKSEEHEAHAQAHQAREAQAQAHDTHEAHAQAHEARLRAVDAYLRAADSAGNAEISQSANGRLEAVENRLSRIEKMLERLINDKKDRDE